MILIIVHLIIEKIDNISFQNPLSGISNGYYLSQGTSTEGQPVFFDLLGAFVVRFPMNVAVIASLIVLSLAIANIYLNIAAAKKRGIFLNESNVYDLLLISESIFRIAFVDPRAYMSSLQKACFILAISWIITSISCCGLAMLLTGIGRAMSWFARPFWLYTLYALQTVSIPALCLLIATSKQRLVILFLWYFEL